MLIGRLIGISPKKSSPKRFVYKPRFGSVSDDNGPLSIKSGYHSLDRHNHWQSVIEQTHKNKSLDLNPRFWIILGVLSIAAYLILVGL